VVRDTEIYRNPQGIACSPRADFVFTGQSISGAGVFLRAGVSGRISRSGSKAGSSVSSGGGDARVIGPSDGLAVGGRIASYGGDEQKVACRRTLVEILHVLDEHGPDVFLTCGWAVSLLLEKHAEDPGFVSVGGRDIDLNVNSLKVDLRTFEGLIDRLVRRGYAVTERQHNNYFLRRAFEGSTVMVELDWPSPRDLLYPVNRLAFEGMNERIALRERLPDSTEQREAEVVSSDIVGCLCERGFHIARRSKPRDPYDVYSLCRYYGTGPEEVARRVGKTLGVEVVREAVAHLAEAFGHEEARGPRGVVDFIGSGNDRQAAEIKKEAYQSVHRVLELLKY